MNRERGAEALRQAELACAESADRCAVLASLHGATPDPLRARPGCSTPAVVRAPARPSGRRLSLCHAGRKVALHAIVPPGLSRHTLRHLRAARGAAQKSEKPTNAEPNGAARLAAPKSEGAARTITKRVILFPYRTLEVRHQKGVRIANAVSNLREPRSIRIR